MQTVEWTDGKLEERLDRIDERFVHFDQRFNGVDSRFDRVEGDLRDIKATLNRVLIGLALGFLTVLSTLVGLLGTIIAKG